MPLNIDDVADCVSDVALEAAVAAAVGGRALDAMDVRVELAPIGEEIVLTVEVAWRELVWSDTESVLASECGSDVVKLLVDSVVRGTSEWGIRTRTGVTRLHLAASAGAGPWAVAPSGHLALSRAWGDRAWRPALHARATAGVVPAGAVSTYVDAAGHSTTESAWIGVDTFEIGGGVERASGSAWTPSAVLLGGCALAYGIGYPRDSLAVVPSVRAGAGLSLAVSDVVALSGEVLASPLLVDLGTGQDHVAPVRLPPIRAALGGSVRL